MPPKLSSSQGEGSSKVFRAAPRDGPAPGRPTTRQRWGGGQGGRKKKIKKCTHPFDTIEPWVCLQSHCISMETLIVIACNRAITDSGPARNALPKCTRAAAAASTPAQRPEPPLPQSPQSPLKMRGRAERLGRSVARSSAPGL